MTGAIATGVFIFFGIIITEFVIVKINPSFRVAGWLFSASVGVFVGLAINGM